MSADRALASGLLTAVLSACSPAAERLPSLPPDSAPASTATAASLTDKPVFTPYYCNDRTVVSDSLSYAAERVAFVQFADSIGADDKCWLVRRGLRIVRLFPETASANVMLPDTFRGDLREENERIVVFSVRMR